VALPCVTSASFSREEEADAPSDAVSRFAKARKVNEQPLFERRERNVEINGSGKTPELVH